ncbi:MAG: helix-turn-helix domain-containing protein [Ilumatobacteraceae bacterium]
MSTAVSRVEDPDVGILLKHWRAVRRMSQLDLASEARTTARHVSFVETGRSQPSRLMVLRLARVLDLPQRERNELLLAAGFAPLYAAEDLSGPALHMIDRAVTAMLEQHEPFPAVVMDRAWNIVRANRGAANLFGRLFRPAPVPAAANVLRLMIEPGPVRDRVVNWSEVVPALLERATREAVGRVLDQPTATLVADLRARPDVAELLAEERPPLPPPVVDVRFDVDGVDIAFFSVVSTIGTPVDVTAQELKIESFFPSDAQSSDRWHRAARDEIGPVRAGS